MPRPRRRATTCGVRDFLGRVPHRAASQREPPPPPNVRPHGLRADRSRRPHGSADAGRRASLHARSPRAGGAVRKLEGRSGVYVPTRSGVEEAHLQRGDARGCVRGHVSASSRRRCTSGASAKAASRSSSSAKACAASSAIDQADDRPHPRRQQQQHGDLHGRPSRPGAAAVPVALGGVAGDTGGDYFRSNDLEQALQTGRRPIERVLPARLRADRPPARRTFPQDQGPREASGLECAHAQAIGRRASPKSTRADEGRGSRDSGGHGAERWPSCRRECPADD